MNTNMPSIRSILIRTCMSNVQKEISQLEHWLINLSDDIHTPAPSIPSKPSNQYDEHIELSNLNRVIEQFSS